MSASDKAHRIDRKLVNVTVCKAYHTYVAIRVSTFLRSMVLTCALAEDGDVARVSAEVVDVLLNPAQRLDLVEEAVVARRCRVPRAQEPCRAERGN